MKPRCVTLNLANHDAGSSVGGDAPISLCMYPMGKRPNSSVRLASPSSPRAARMRASNVAHAEREAFAEAAY
jgi:hypothetical protein